MKILFQNFGYGSGHRGSLRDYVTRPHHFVRAPLEPLAAFGKLLRSHTPDVVAVSELDLGSFRTRRYDPLRLFRAFGYQTMVASQKYKPKGILAHTPIFRTQGNGFFFHTEPLTHQFHFLSHGIKRLVIEASFRGGIHIFLIHLSLRRSARILQLAELEEVIAGHTHVIILGDFNTLSHKEDLAVFCERTKLRSLNIDHDPTFPSSNPRLELDYALVSPTIRVKKFEVLTTHVADHLPLLLEIR